LIPVFKYLLIPFKNDRNSTKDKIPLAGGFRYKNARRPELYRDIIGKNHQPTIKPVWMK